jgi:hypothetical protein
MFHPLLEKEVLHQEVRADGVMTLPVADVVARSEAVDLVEAAVGHMARRTALVQMMPHHLLRLQSRLLGM